MSNRTVLERLLVEIEMYGQERKNRDAFAERFAKTIEALEGIPYSVITDASDWQYKIETEGFFYEEDCESELEAVITKLKEWVNELIASHS